MRNLGALLRRIELGEDSNLELKRVLVSGEDKRVIGPKRDDFADELAAMANMRGGQVILGVEDRRREVVGIPVKQLDLVETWIRDICNDSIRPPLEVIVNKLDLPDRDDVLRSVIKIDIPQSLVIHESPRGYFRRIGSSRRKIPPESLARVIQERTQFRVIRFDHMAVPGSSLEDLDIRLASRFLPGNARASLVALQKLHIVADDDEDVSRLTVAGILLASRSPTDWMPAAYIQAVHYVGERPDVNYQIDARDFKGPLDHQVFGALAFVRRNMLVGASKALARTERPQYSERAVFEALVNAVAHRDYSMTGARIRLHMFPNRLELFVPGALANTLTPDSMHLRQYTRNELITSLLARCRVSEGENLARSHVMDRRGDGVPIIRAESQELAGRDPEYTVIDDSELRLVIWAAN